MREVVIPATRWRPEVTREMLEGREAQCPYCKRTAPSDVELPFFDYRGPGNGQYCDECPWAREVHEKPVQQLTPNVRAHWHNHRFNDELGRGYDSYYCGCRGWE